MIDYPAGQRKHELAEQYLGKTTVTHGLFLVLVWRAQAPVWDVTAKHHLERRPMPYVNHYSFHILDHDWGHLTIKISGHPPFPAQAILNGPEYVACQAHKTRIGFAKQTNCFTSLSDPAGFAKVADTLSDPRAVGRLSRVCDRWILRPLVLRARLRWAEAKGVSLPIFQFQIEYGRNLTQRPTPIGDLEAEVRKILLHIGSDLQEASKTGAP